jgi:hypothetical protein
VAGVSLLPALCARFGPRRPGGGISLSGKDCRARHAVQATPDPGTLLRISRADAARTPLLGVTFDETRRPARVPRYESPAR